MAIPYGAKLFESTSLTRVVSHALTTTVKEGATICVGFAGQRTSALIAMSSISDSKGNAWDFVQFTSTYKAVGVAWARTKAAMVAGDTISFTWNGTPTYSWKSAHSFEGADDSELEKAYAIGTDSSAEVTMTVTGSDWLSFCCVMCPYSDSPTLTPLAAATERDNNAKTTRPWAAVNSLNGTTGAAINAGASGVTGGSWAVAAVTLPYQAMPSTATATLLGGLLGI